MRLPFVEFIGKPRGLCNKLVLSNAYWARRVGGTDHYGTSAVGFCEFLYCEPLLSLWDSTGEHI